MLLRAPHRHGHGRTRHLQAPRVPPQEGNAQTQATPSAEKKEENRGALGSRARHRRQCWAWAQTGRSSCEGGRGGEAGGVEVGSGDVGPVQRDRVLEKRFSALPTTTNW